MTNVFHCLAQTLGRGSIWANALRRRTVSETRLKRLIVFDFDGVIADSEILANAVLAEIVTELGTPMTLEASMDKFMGKRFDDVIAEISAMTGRPAANCRAVDLERRTIARFRGELKEISGIRAYLEAFGGVKRCVASSSSPDRLAACLDNLIRQPLKLLAITRIERKRSQTIEHLRCPQAS